MPRLWKVSTAPFSIVTYLTYGNIAWCNTWMAKLKTIFSKQEQVTTSISSDYKNLKSQKTMENLGIWKIWVLNIYQTVNPTLKKKNITIPEAFRTKLQLVQQNCTIRHSENNFEEPKMTFKGTKFFISSRGCRLWNKYTDRFFKTITSALLFKSKLKECQVKLKRNKLFLIKKLTNSRYILWKLALTL